MRKIIDIFLTANLLFITLAVAYMLYSGDLVIQYKSIDKTNDDIASYESSVRSFSETLKDGVNRKSGVPENGYQPELLLAAFPGLSYTDFDGVNASVGKYVVVDGQLVHVTTPDTLLHSAIGAITSAGFEVLLHNVASRTQINLSGKGTITQIMNSISN